jgi:hypothetical protein
MEDAMPKGKSFSIKLILTIDDGGNIEEYEVQSMRGLSRFFTESRPSCI